MAECIRLTPGWPHDGLVPSRRSDPPLPSKPRQHCQRPTKWRAKWGRSWD